MSYMVNPLQAGTGLSIDWTTFQLHNTGVLSFQGSNGDITLVEGAGVSISGLTITNAGVLSFQGSAGDITLTAGKGIGITGLTVVNTGVLTFAGVAGNITIDNGFSLTSNKLSLVADTGISISASGIAIDIIAGTGISVSGNTIDVTIDNTYIIESSGSLTINQGSGYNWGGTHYFNGGFNLNENEDILPAGTATSSSNYNSYQLNFYNSVWETSSGSGTVGSGNITFPSAYYAFAYVYVDGSQVAAIVAIQANASTTFTMPSGNHTLEVKIVSNNGGSNSNSVSKNFNGGTYTLNAYVSYSTQYTASCSVGYSYASGGNAVEYEGTIYLDTNGNLHTPTRIYVDDTVGSNGNGDYGIGAYAYLIADNLSNAQWTMQHGNYQITFTKYNGSSWDNAVIFSSGTAGTTGGYSVNASNFNTGSDSKLKADFVENTSSILSEIPNIKHGNWTKQFKLEYINDIQTILTETYDVGNQIGILADTLPSLYQERDTSSGIYYINSNKMYAMFTKAIQELIANQKQIAEKLGITLQY